MAGHGELFDRILILCAFVSVAACYAFYLGRTELIIHSDMATEILTGREMFLQKTPFLKEYYHSTEIFLIRTSLFVALWLFATDTLMSAFRLAVVTDIVLQIAGYLYMTKRLGVSGKAAALGLLAFFGARTYVSGEFAGMGASSYGTMYAAVFATVGFYAALRLGTLNRTDSFVRLLLPVLALLFGISSMRFLYTVIGPLILAHVAAKIWSRLPHDWTRDKVLRELMIWAALAAGGWLYTRYVIMPRGFGPLEKQTLAANGLAGVWTDTLPRLVLELVRFNPLDKAAGEFRFTSIAGAAGVLCVLFYAACLWGLIRTSRPVFPTRCTIYRFFIISIAIMALSSLTLLNSIEVKLRYLAMIYALAALVPAVHYGDLSSEKPGLARAFLALSCVFFIVNSLQTIREFPIAQAVNPSRVAVRRTGEIEDSLRRHGINRAYSLYWQSAVETVLTNGRIEVCGVFGDMTPVRYMANYDVYSPERSSERTAYILVDIPVAEGFEGMVQFGVTDRTLLNEAESSEIIRDTEGDVTIFYFDRNPFVFPQSHDPSKDFVPAYLVN
jgi:hypothetical protein